MNYKTKAVLPAVVLAGCSSAPLPTPMNIDNHPANATVTVSGTRERIDVIVDPEAATLSGKPLGPLAFHIALSGATDCPGECLKMPVRVPLDGQATTGSFVLGGATYQIGPLLDPATNRYVFVQSGDPLALPRGTAGGLFELYHLDASGASFQILFAPLFAEEYPVPGVVHLIATGSIDVDFER